MRSHRGDRIGIGVTGVLLVAVGGYALLANDVAPQVKVVDVEFFVANGWSRSLWASLLVLLALATTRWLAISLGGGRGTRHGSGTAVLGVALRGLEGVDRMQVNEVGKERIRIAMRCEPDVRLGELVKRLDEEAVSRVRGELGAAPDLPVLATIHLGR